MTALQQTFFNGRKAETLRFGLPFLIHADRCKDTTDKPKTGEGTDVAGHQCESERKERRVSKEQDCGDKQKRGLIAFLRGVEDDTVKEDVESRSSSGKECRPPPRVVFRCEPRVGHNDADFNASDDKEDEDKEKKSKHVKDLIVDDARENEDELEVDDAEGSDTREEAVEVPRDVEGRRRDFTGNVVRLAREFVRGYLVAHERANESQRDRQSKPHEQEKKHGHERHRTRGLHEEKDGVAQEKHEESRTREAKASSDGDKFFVLALEHCVLVRGHVTSDGAGEDHEEEERGEEPPAICWREKSEESKANGARENPEDLRAQALEDAVEDDHGRRAEDVAVD
mmetsp:Transcript_9134/g.22753  ORF Transcript_9134/g.22753 Transcript_9134/m.22753 type:complete len:341 (-) Transcript_9134:493-1515(-)